MNEGLFNRGVSLFWTLFRLNLMFVASNIVLLGTMMTIPFHLFTLPFYLLGVFLVVPSLLALFLTFRRLEEVDKTSLFKLYVRCYREEFKGSGLFALAYIVVGLFLLGAYLASPYLPTQLPLIGLYGLLAIILYVHFIFGLMIRVNFFITIPGTWRLGMYCISKYPMYALFIFGGTLILGALMNMFPILIPMGAVPAAGYLLKISTEKLFRDIAVDLNIPNGDNGNIESEENGESENKDVGK